jgi:predicted MPP superfamily phosphohydrolase
MKKLFIALLFLHLYTFSSCASCTPSVKALTEADWFIPDKTLTVWTLSDTHIRDEAHIKPFENAADINDNVPDVDMVINAGDVVNFPNEESYELYVKTRGESYIGEWHEIIGNHDYKTDKRKTFQSTLDKKPYYTVEKGNILFIFMSNEAKGKATVISDETFEWWKNLVINNRDKIIVTVTHAPPGGSGITFSGLKARQIRGSGRFREVLKSNNVDLWFSGHLHIPEELFGTIVKKHNLSCTVFIELSSIRPDLQSIKEPESRVVTFACGSDKVLIRSRNHNLGIYMPGTDRVLTLSKPYECD